MVSRLANWAPFAETVVSTKLTYFCLSDTRDVTSTACQDFARSGPDRTKSREATGALAKVILLFAPALGNEANLVSGLRASLAEEQEADHLDLAVTAFQVDVEHDVRPQRG